MKTYVDQCIYHYATVTNGESALFREGFLLECVTHGVSERELSDALAVAIAKAFVSGELDDDGAAFMVTDLLWAAGGGLQGFALQVFDALEYKEASIAEVWELLSTQSPQYRRDLC